METRNKQVRSINSAIRLIVMLFAANFAMATNAYADPMARYQEIISNASTSSISTQSLAISPVETLQVNSSILNGGFETGDFTSWVAGDNGVTGLMPWQVCAKNTCGFFLNNEPIEGLYDAANGFDGDAGYEAFLYQDIQVPQEGVAISFSDRIQYDSGGLPSTLPRIYEVQVRDINNQLLQVLFHQEVLLDGQLYTDLGWQQRSFNLSNYAGQAVRIYISLFVPESFTGPANIEFDDFKLEPVPGDGSGISGCISEDGSPISGRQVLLLQNQESPQVTTTDSSGCYNFGTVVKGKNLDVMIRKPLSQRK